MRDYAEWWVAVRGAEISRKNWCSEFTPLPPNTRITGNNPEYHSSDGNTAFI